MNPVLFIQLTLMIISLTLAIIFAMAWKSMGRKTYTLIWAITFVVIVVQHTANIFQDAISPFWAYWVFVCILSMMSASMGAWGHILRTQTNVPKYLLPGGLAVFALLTFYFTAIDHHVGLRMSLYIFYNVVVLVFVGVIILRHRRRPRPAEIGTAASYFFLALFQTLAGVLALLQGEDVNPLLRETYIYTNFVTLPATFTAMGLFTVFMLASDLSEDMRKLAITDTLTDCLNRRGFTQRAARSVTALQKASRHICLIYWDIDKFKAINDEYGHAGGDEVLKQTVDCIKAHVKQDDLLGRLGGEEFVILLGRVELQDALGVAERLRRAIEHNQVVFRDHSISVTASFGVAVLESSVSDIQLALESADSALYKAKQQGRNQVVLSA